MRKIEELTGLDEARQQAAARFIELHSGDDFHNVTWIFSCEVIDEPLLRCECGATLHLGEDIFVEVEPIKFEWDDLALQKSIVDKLISVVRDPKVFLFDPTPLGFFNYAMGFANTYELANRDEFPNGMYHLLMRAFVEEILGDVPIGKATLEKAIDACGSDVDAFARIEKVLTELILKVAPDIESVDITERSERLKKWGMSCDADAAIESVYQSALVTLPDELLEQVRHNPSSSEMHFGLGLYLRNRFIHSGLLWRDMDPDRQSSRVIERLIRHCLPEFEEYDLVYDRINYGVLYDAYRYCIELRGELPSIELKKHYDILLEAKEIDDANPYSILDDDWDNYRGWELMVWEKQQEYDRATLREIWNFEKIRNDVGDAIAEKCEKICLAGMKDDEPVFFPSEIAYVLAGSDEEFAMKAFDWVIRDSSTVKYLPDSMFERRDFALRVVGLEGSLLERAVAYQDDDEVILTAVSNNPNAIMFASLRLQKDRRVLVTAAANAKDELVFFEGPMAKHNDDDELVTLALKANGMNIAFASKRVRGNLNYAKLAWENVHNCTHPGMYDNLSDELKKNLELALVIARNCDMPPFYFPPIELVDNDELGAALAARGDNYYLAGMSRRIKKKYMTEEELERWGSDPYWWTEDGGNEDEFDE